MSEIIEQITLNGETTKVLKLTGTGYHIEAIDDFASGLSATGTLCFSLRHNWTGPAETPGQKPDVFIGLCAEDQGYAEADSHAYGWRLFYDSFALDPFTFTDNGFYTSMYPWKSVNGSQSALTSGVTFWMNRYEKAAGTQPFAFTFSDLGTGNWLIRPITHAGAFNSVTMSQDEFDIGASQRTLDKSRAAWAAAYTPGIPTSLGQHVGTSFTEPDQGTYGTLNHFNLWWSIPEGHGMYLHSMHIHRQLA